MLRSDWKNWFPFAASKTASETISAKPISASKRFQPAPELEEKARVLLREIGATALANEVLVRWNRALRSTAGMASYAQRLITLNPRIVAFGDAEIDRTLRHELAHLLAQFRSGKKRIAPHGAEWRDACRALAISDETRCHTLPLPRKKIARNHLYRCPHCAVEIRRVRPYRRRVACLACCRSHNRGHYDERFRLQKIPLAPTH